MMTRYELALRSERPCAPAPEWGYRLYAALLQEAPEQFGADVHQDAVTPLSQFVTVGRNEVRWTISLLGEESERSLSPLLAQQRAIRLEKERLLLSVTDRRIECIRDVDELFARAANADGLHLLFFQTPTAFKSQGQYLNLPTTRLIVQSLIRKWNGCFPECAIEDEDGQGMEALAAGLRCRRFQLRNGSYHLKGSAIPGFVGELALENRLTGFHRELANALLLFSAYSGVGIKTALGMGGVRHSLESK